MISKYWYVTDVSSSRYPFSMSVRHEYFDKLEKNCDDRSSLYLVLIVKNILNTNPSDYR